MPGRQYLKEGANLHDDVNDPDYAINSNLPVSALRLVGKSKAASIAMHAAMEQCVFPFSIAHWAKNEALIIDFETLADEMPQLIKKILQENAPWIE